MHYLWIILIQTQTHISANEDQFRLVREQKIAPMAPSHLQLWLPVVYWCDLSEVNDGCVACNSKIITFWRIWPYLAYILHAAAPMTCQAVVGKNPWCQRLKLRMRAVKGLRVAARLRWRGCYIVRVHDPLQGQMFHLTGPLSGGQFCQLSPFLPHMQPFVGRVLKAGGNQQNGFAQRSPPLQLLSKTNSPVKLQFTQQCFCLPQHCSLSFSMWPAKSERIIALPLFQVKPFAFTFSLV